MSIFILYSSLGNSLNYGAKTACSSAFLCSRRDSGAYFCGVRVFFRAGKKTSNRQPSKIIIMELFTSNHCFTYYIYFGNTE